MECLVVMENIYNVDACKSPTSLYYIANMLLGQNGCLKKLKKAIQMILKHMILKNSVL